MTRVPKPVPADQVKPEPPAAPPPFRLPSAVLEIPLTMDMSGLEAAVDQACAEISSLRVLNAELVAALKEARCVLEDATAQASLCANQTALTSWPHQRDWLINAVRSVTRHGIAGIDVAITKAEAR